MKMIFGFLHGFGMICDFNTSYYIMNFSTDTIFVLNDNYGYMTKKSFSEPAFMKAINTSLYIVCINNFQKKI
jgi:hypothetical protein